MHQVRIGGPHNLFALRKEIGIRGSSQLPAPCQLASGLPLVGQMNVGCRFLEVASQKSTEVRLTPGTGNHSPSISRDCRWLAYVEDTPGKSNNIVLTDLKSGKKHTLDEASRRSNYGVGNVKLALFLGYTNSGAWAASFR
jgi:hypothetical protein